MALKNVEQVTKEKYITCLKHRDEYFWDADRLRKVLAKIVELTEYLVDCDEDICSEQTHKERLELLNMARATLVGQEYPANKSDGEK